MIQNSAAFGGSDYTDSTIKILFTAIMIVNADYANDSVIVTAGAEYDSEKFVWVSQAKFSYDQALVSNNNRKLINV